MNRAIDVFLSRKSQDEKLAKKLFDFLTAKNLVVFDSGQTLHEFKNTDYSKAIDEALLVSKNLIVIGSSIDHFTSPWVEAEWRFFLNRKRSGKVKGNLFSVINDGLSTDDLPPSLQYYEIIEFKEENFEKIYSYIVIDTITKESAIPTQGSFDKASSHHVSDPLKRQETSTVIKSNEESILRKNSSLEDLLRGIRHYDKKEIEEAVIWLKKAAEFNIAEAQYYLGMSYKIGLKRRPAPEEHVYPYINIQKRDELSIAKNWFILASDQGHREAQFELGFLYERESKYGQALNMYAKAAGKEHPDAQYRLAYFYDNGLGTVKEIKTALKWYIQAAKNGNRDAQFTIGLYFKRGIGIDKNSHAAASYFLKAAEQGHPEAYFYIGSCYDYGDGIEQDKAEAAKWYRKAAAKGDSIAKLHLDYITKSSS
ncbi:hypothetical protein GCM10027299_23000 [Larkinella ripae]